MFSCLRSFYESIDNSFGPWKMYESQLCNSIWNKAPSLETPASYLAFNPINLIVKDNNKIFEMFFKRFSLKSINNFAKNVNMLT